MLDKRHTPLPLRSNDNNYYIFGRIKDHNIIVYLFSGVTGIISAVKIIAQIIPYFHMVEIRADNKDRRWGVEQRI
jgi:hypothetical protein